MTAVPLTVVVRSPGGQLNVDITQRVQGLSFRKVIPGGYASATFKLSEPIGQRAFYQDPFSQVSIYDSRNGSTVWEGRLEDTGRSVDSSGPAWEMTASGPMVYAVDVSVSPVYVDRALDRWFRSGATAPRSATTERSSLPDTETDALLMQFAPGEPIDTGSVAAMRYALPAGGELGGYEFSWDGGGVAANQEVQSVSSPDNVLITNHSMDATGQTAQGAGIGGGIAAGNDELVLRQRRVAGGATTISTDANWLACYDIYVRGAIYNKSGTKILHTTSGGPVVTDYRDGFVQADQVVEDLLGTVLTKFDGANASVSATATHHIDQLAYPDGTRASQVLDDVIALEPDFYWAAGAKTATGFASFTWRGWPTAVRYEIYPDDGFNSPGASAEIYNKVQVRWNDERGRAQITTRTSSVPALTAAGLTREPDPIDLADEIGSLTNAQRVGDKFLEQHATPTNGGTLTVSRPVWDRDQCRYVAPHEIEPGYVARVLGIGSSVSEATADTVDGNTVFRLVATDYSSDDGSARLDLGVAALTAEQIVADIARRRRRKR